MAKTGIVKHPLYLEHKTGIMHPENPYRLESIYTMLESRDFGGALVEIPPRFAKLTELLLVHDPNYVDRVLDSAEKTQIRFDPDTVTSAKSYKAAWMAAGGVMEAVRAVLAGEARNAFALIRPPGHHALRDRAMGFCIFNNLAIGARYALKCQGLERVMIVDWDLHHGNGIQDIFYDDPHVLYVSIHRYPFFPWTGGAEEVGEGKGKGFNVNVPLEYGCSDPDYANIYRHLLWPIARRFKPETILVAAGFDIHHGDPLRSMNVTEAGFARMTQLLMEMASELCGKRLILALEGGYNSEALRDSVATVLWELVGRSVINKEEMRQVEDARFGNIEKTIQKVKKIQMLYWGAL
ncbi:MAG TPA: histone deacetylase [Thermodesulfobacteriota bacterium]|nr:histone deacetylase [Thermodesulfobacteriota bacterium]